MRNILHIDRKYAQALILTLIILLVTGFCSYLIDNEIELRFLSLSTFADVASILSGILTLVLALLIYRKFTGAQLLVDKQTEQVMLLIELISSSYFVFSLPDVKGPKSFYMSDIYLNELHIGGKNLRSYMKNEFEGYVYVAMDSTDRVTSHLMKLSSAVYLPASVAKTLDYHFSSVTPWWHSETVEKDDKYKVIEVSMDNDSYLSIDKLDPYSTKAIIFPVQLSESLVECYNEAIKWIKNNNSDVFNELNIKTNSPEKV